MNERTADATVKFIIETNCQDRDVRVTFYGGESLLELKLIKSMVSKLYEVLGERVEFAVSTNGFLLKEDVVDWICSYKRFNVYVSIDSYKELHDRNRITIRGSKTFNQIITNLERFDKKYHERYLLSVFFLVTLSSWEDLPMASQRWSDTGVLRHRPPMHLSFVLPRNVADVKVMSKSMEERKTVLDLALSQYEAGQVNLLTSQFKYWTDVINHDSQAVQTNDDIIVTTCVEDFYRTFISSEGDIYICERFAKKFIIGTVFEGLYVDAPNEIEDSFIKFRNRQCNDCEVVNQCSKCMTILNYEDDIEMIEALCDLERKNIKLIAEYAWKRRMIDRKRCLIYNRAELSNPKCC